MFQLIKCIPRSEIYYNAYQRKLKALANCIYSEDMRVTQLMSIIFLGVKTYVTSNKKDEPKTYDYLMAKFKAMETLKALMTVLTPRQFINVFPITKEYDGERYGIKDYFFTMDMIKEMGIDTPIGERIDDFLWDYRNRDLSIFLVESMSVASDIMRVQGQPGLMEKMSVEFGIPLYIANEKEKAITGPVNVKQEEDEYYYDYSEAKTTPFKKRAPDYLRVVT